MIYYSTGKGSHLNRRGSAVEVDDSTAKILIERGLLVRTKSELYQTKTIIDNPEKLTPAINIVNEVKEKSKPTKKVLVKDSKSVSKKGRPKRK